MRAAVAKCGGRGALPGLEASCAVRWFGAGGLFFTSRRRHTRFKCDWSSDVCSSDLSNVQQIADEHFGSTPVAGGVWTVTPQQPADTPNVALARDVTIALAGSNLTVTVNGDRKSVV